MSTPEQHRPPVYACAAGAVLHAHAAATLEPAVLLYTFLPTGGADRLDALEAKVDVHGNGPGSPTLTVRVLSEGQSVSWQLPIAPFVAALPGQPGDDGRMVLLGVLDAEPEQGFWAEPVDCERLAAELQLPVTDLVDALRGRLTPWLADDVDLLLHDDAHEHAADLSPAQTLASAVLAHYRQDLEADAAVARVVRAFDFAPQDFQAELGARLCIALATAVAAAGAAGVTAVLEQTGPFEPEVLRLLSDLPPVLAAADPSADESEAAASVLLAGPDHAESLRAAVSAVARLARSAFGTDLAGAEVLRRLSMVDDAGQLRLADLWVELAGAVAGAPSGDPTVAAGLAARVAAEGAPGGAWLRSTAAAVGSLALEVAGRSRSQVAEPIRALEVFLADRPELGATTSSTTAAAALERVLALARFARSRAGVGPGRWRQVPVEAAAAALGSGLSHGLERELAVDLLVELLEDDVEGPDVLEAFVCATAQLLIELDPMESPESTALQVPELLAAVQGGPRGARWLMAACLREAPEHDPAAADLRPWLPSETAADVDRLASKAGVRAVMAAGLQVLEALTGVLGTSLGVPREEALSQVLPSALLEHDLLQGPADQA